MAAQNLWFYREKIFRIVEECMEVALVICNTELSEFTLAKIFDIFNQILPTGFVLNTGYWPFYNTLKKQSICICARYGIDCRHFKHDRHWIDLESINMDTSTIFFNKLGQLCLVNSETEVTPVTGGAAGYTLNIKLTFQYKKIEKGRSRRKKDENLNINQDQVIQVLIYSRYNVQREYYPAFHTIMFQPSPFFNETYGTYFPKLLQARSSAVHSNLPPEINQRFYTSALENMPHFSLILQHANLPMFVFSKNMHAVFAHLDPPKIKRTTHNRSCQTEEHNNIEVWKYKELIGNLKPIWSDSRTASYESLYSNAQAVNADYIFETVVFDDTPGQGTIVEIKNEVAPNAITESIINGTDHFNVVEEKSIKNKYLELPTSTNYDMDYDVQWPKWGYHKAVTKKRGKKKNQSIHLYKDVLAGIQMKVEPAEVKTIKADNTQEDHNKIIISNSEINLNSTYAAIVKHAKTEYDVYGYPAATKATVYETYKDDPDFQWFESEFPDAQRFIPLSEAERNERFAIAEEFITEEMEREKNKKDDKRS